MNSTPLALIVDDDITLRVLAREALEQAGCRVEDAATGQEALEAFQRETPDISSWTSSCREWTGLPPAPPSGNCRAEPLCLSSS